MHDPRRRAGANAGHAQNERPSVAEVTPSTSFGTGTASNAARRSIDPGTGSIDRRAAFEAIPVNKDVDGVTSSTLGRVILGMPAWASCTPAGIMRLLREYNVELDGAHAIVIGRSPILGRPMASMLINAHATVTLCHSRTRSLPSLVRNADVVIAAVGKPRFVRGGWIKVGAVVIDAGYNEGNIGDVDFEGAIEPASLITPVPGGVGADDDCHVMQRRSNSALRSSVAPVGDVVLTSLLCAQRWQERSRIPRRATGADATARPAPTAHEKRPNVKLIGDVLVQRLAGTVPGLRLNPQQNRPVHELAACNAAAILRACVGSTAVTLGGREEHGRIRHALLNVIEIACLSHVSNVSGIAKRCQKNR